MQIEMEDTFLYWKENFVIGQLQILNFLGQIVHISSRFEKSIPLEVAF